MSGPGPLLAAWARARLVGDTPGGFAAVWRKPLAALYDASTFDESDVVTSMEQVPAARLVWEAILTEAAIAVEKETDKAPTKIEFARAFSVALTPFVTGPVTPPVTRDGYTPLGEGVEAARMPGRSAPKIGDAAATPLPREMAEDMEVQSASDPSELYRLNVGLELGKKAVAVECVGGTYGSDPALSDGMKRAAKSKMATLRVHLAKAMESGDLMDIDRHISRTTSKWMADPADLLHMTGGSRLSQVWNKCKTLRPTDGRVAACMLHLMLDERVGRGLPVLTDTELSQTARERYAATAPPATTWGALSKGRGTPTDTDSDSGSSLGSSASASATGVGKQMDQLLTLVTTRFDDMATSNTKLVARIDRIESKTADLGQKVSGLRAPSGATEGGGITCNYCHEKGHVVANCPVLKAKQAKEAETKAKED